MSSSSRTLPEPSFQPNGMSCRKCGHDWLEHSPVNIEVSRWAAYMKAIRCPSCGAGIKAISFGRKIGRTRNLERTDFTKSLQHRIDDWRQNGDVGLSSEAIAHAATSDASGRRLSHPLDISDLIRCVLLVDRIPEFDISKMAPVSKEWSAISAHWAELTDLLLRELGPDLLGKEAPETYRLLSSLTKIET